MVTPFSLYLKSLKVAHDIKSIELCKAIGIGPSFLSSLERGKRGKPDKELVLKIAKFFNLTDEQRNSFIAAAEISDPRLALPQNSTIADFQLAYKLFDRITSLSDLQRRIINDALDYQDTNDFDSTQAKKINVQNNDILIDRRYTP